MPTPATLLSPGNATPGSLFAARPLSHQSRAEMCETFDRAIRLAESGRLRLRVPHEVKPGQRLRHMHYHYRPEFFLQLSGVTTFEFPRESFELGPDEACVPEAHCQPLGACVPTCDCSNCPNCSGGSRTLRNDWPRKKKPRQNNAGISAGAIR